MVAATELCLPLTGTAMITSRTRGCRFESTRERWHQRRGHFCRRCTAMPSSISSTECGWGGTGNSASWMVFEDLFETGLTTTSSPSLHHSTFDPGTRPSFSRMRDSIETSPCDVILDSIRVITVPLVDQHCGSVLPGISNLELVVLSPPPGETLEPLHYRVDATIMRSRHMEE